MIRSRPNCGAAVPGGVAEGSWAKAGGGAASTNAAAG